MTYNIRAGVSKFVVRKEVKGTSRRHQIAAAVIGNALEWYDFTIYGYLAVTISKLFFPPEAGWLPLLETLALFAVAYLARPFGGIVLGYYADRLGRKTLLIFVMGLMGAGTALIAFAPTYRTIGAVAPLIILFARILQGLSAGGEFSSAMSFLVEHAPPSLRGFYGAWQFSGQGAAILLSGIVGSLIACFLTVEQLESWGWRLPFFLGLVIGPVGLYIRLKLSETPGFLRGRSNRADRNTPVARMLLRHHRRVLIGLGLVLGGTAAFYVLFIFMPTYAVRVLNLGVGASFAAPIVAGLTVTVCCPPMGYLADRIGRKPVMGAAAAVLLAAVYPAFAWLQQEPSVKTLAALEVGFGLLFSAYVGSFSAAIAEMFPIRIRATAMAIAYNFGVVLFGGGAPFIVAWLIAQTGDPLAPAYYVMGGLFLTLLAVAAMPAPVDDSARVRGAR